MDNHHTAEQWPVEIDLQTNDGADIEIIYRSDIMPPNRGFVIDKLEAYVDGELAGYLSIENVPSASLETFYPSGAANHAGHINGQHLFSWPNDSTDWKTCEIGLLNNFLGYFQRNGVRAIPTTVETRDEFWQVFETHIAQSRRWKEIEKSYAAFVDYHVDKPFVTYSETRNPRKLDWNQEPISHEGRGIAKALYMAASIELAKRGLRLRKSTLISPEANGLWQGFADKGLVTINDKGQVHLNAQAVAAYLDQTASSTRRHAGR